MQSDIPNLDGARVALLVAQSCYDGAAATIRDLVAMVTP